MNDLSENDQLMYEAELAAQPFPKDLLPKHLLYALSVLVGVTSGIHFVIGDSFFLLTLVISLTLSLVISSPYAIALNCACWMAGLGAIQTTATFFEVLVSSQWSFKAMPPRLQAHETLYLWDMLLLGSLSIWLATWVATVERRYQFFGDFIGEIEEDPVHCSPTRIVPPYSGDSLHIPREETRIVVLHEGGYVATGQIEEDPLHSQTSNIPPFFDIPPDSGHNVQITAEETICLMGREEGLDAATEFEPRTTNSEPTTSKDSTEDMTAASWDEAIRSAVHEIV